MTTLVLRVDLNDSGIRLVLKVPIVDGGVEPVVNATELIIRCDVPMGIRRRGVEMRLVIEGNRAPAPRADPALLKAMAGALHWSDELRGGQAPSIAKVAEREGVSAHFFMRQLMRWHYWHPKIVEMIAAGKQPPELTAEALSERRRISPSFGPCKKKL